MADGVSPDSHPELAALDFLCGDWIGQDRMEFGPGAVVETTSRLIARFMLARRYLVLDWRQYHGDALCYEARGLLSWDAEANELVMYWFDSNARTHVPARAVGVGAAGELVLREQTPLGWSRQRYVHSNEGLRIDFAESADGAAWTTVLVSRLHRDERGPLEARAG